MLVNNEFANKYYAVLDKLKPDSTIEIGAYDAEFSQYMAEKIDSKNVWAFEALPNIYNAFKGKLQHINYVNLAVSDSKKQVTFGELDRDEKLGILSGASSMLERIKKFNSTAVQVEADTVDNLVDANNISGSIALWVDCEGANRQVLSGAVRTLQSTVAIYIEVELSTVWEDQWLKHDTTEFLNNNGFTLVDESDAAVSGGIQQDLIFVKNTLLSIL